MRRYLKYPVRAVIRFVVVHPIGGLAVVVVLAASLFALTGHVSQPFGAQAQAPAVAASIMPRGTVPAPAATEDFMSGQATFNADKVWNSLSPTLQQNLAAQGSDKQAIQTQLDQYKQDGRQIENFTYVGGYTGQDTDYYFYVAQIRQPQGSTTDQVFFAFTVDHQGKIDKVE